MKKIFLSLVIAMFAVVNVNAQIFKSKNYVKPEPKVYAKTQEKTQLEQNMLYMAGKYQTKSAALHFTSMGLAFAGGGLVLVASNSEDMGDDGKNICYGVAGAMMVGALVSEICAINFQLKSGKRLKVAATKITYTFQ